MNDSFFSTKPTINQSFYQIDSLNLALNENKLFQTSRLNQMDNSINSQKDQTDQLLLFNLKVQEQNRQLQEIVYNKLFKEIFKQVKKKQHKYLITQFRFLFLQIHKFMRQSSQKQKQKQQFILNIQNIYYRMKQSFSNKRQQSFENFLQKQKVQKQDWQYYVAYSQQKSFKKEENHQNIENNQRQNQIIFDERLQAEGPNKTTTMKKHKQQQQIQSNVMPKEINILGQNKYYQKEKEYKLLYEKRQSINKKFRKNNFSANNNYSVLSSYLYNKNKNSFDQKFWSIEVIKNKKSIGKKQQSKEGGKK